MHLLRGADSGLRRACRGVTSSQVRQICLRRCGIIMQHCYINQSNCYFPRAVSARRLTQNHCTKTGTPLPARSALRTPSTHLGYIACDLIHGLFNIYGVFCYTIFCFFLSNTLSYVDVFVVLRQKREDGSSLVPQALCPWRVSVTDTRNV